MKKFLLGTCILVITTFACSFSGNSQVEKLVNQADQLVEAEKYTEAIDLYNQALELNANFSYAYSGRGTAYRLLGESELALNDLDKAIQIDKKNYVAYRERGMISYNAGDYQIALTDCNKAVSLNPKYAYGHLCIGYIQWGLNNHEEAISAFTHTIKLDPNNKWAYAYRGELHYFYTENDQQAVDDLSEAIRLDSKWDEPYVYRGYAYIFLDDFQNATNDFEMVLSLTSDESYEGRAYRGLGIIYYDQGDYKNAIDNYTLAIQLLSSEIPGAYFYRGISYEKTGNKDEALKDYKRYLDLDNTDNENTRYACSQVNEITLFSSQNIFGFILNALVRPCTRFDSPNELYSTDSTGTSYLSTDEECIHSIYAPTYKMCDEEYQFLQSQDP